jgi:lipoprotein-releasing system ATP-binding protein
MNKDMLRLASISKTFTHNERIITILDSISIDFIQGNLYAITGASGTGKSTLLHLIAGLDKPTSGTIFFNDINLNTMPHAHYCSFLNKSVGFVFQSSHLIKELSIIENVMLPGLLYNHDKKELTQKALFLLKAVGLSHCIHNSPGELSGGQQQRAALARALINEPAFLIADEPTGNLDNQTGQAMIDLLMNCHKQWHMGIIVSSHDPYVAQAMNTVLELKNGTITQQHKEDAVCSQQKKLLEKQLR